MRSIRSPRRSRALAQGALAAFFALLACGQATAQVCSYLSLTDDATTTVTSTPRFLRFAQADGRWAAVAVRSEGTSNWDIGLSLSSAPFAGCVTFPVVASQELTGIDFVLGDFGAEGTGTRYAPISRTSGSGNATVEWDSGSRTAAVGANLNNLGSAALMDCWNVDLVAGQSYKIGLFGNLPGDYKMYVFKRGASNSWRQKSDAMIVISSNFSFSPILNATTTDRYALVVVNETGSPFGYNFKIRPCVDPPSLTNRVSESLTNDPTLPELIYDINTSVPGFATLAVRTADDGDNLDPTVTERTGPGYYPCDGTYRSGSGLYGPRVDLLVGDFASGAFSPGSTFDIGVSGAPSMGGPGRIEFDQGDETLVADGPTKYFIGGPDVVVRTLRANLVAGTDYIIHVAKCGAARTMLYVFRPFDTSDPLGGGWSTIANWHPAIAQVAVPDVQDFTFTPPVSGPYALVLTNETAENLCWEIGISTCRPRLNLADGVSVGLTANPILQYDGQATGTVHGRGAWSAVAVRPNSPTEDWVVEEWDAPTGSGPAPPPFGCLTGLLGASTANAGTSRLDFLARYDPTLADLKERVATQRIYPASLASPGGGAMVEFEMNNTQLAPGDLVNLFGMTPNELIEVWNIDLVAGQPYGIHFDADGFQGELFVMHSSSTCQTDCPQEYFALGGAGQVLRTSQPTVYTPSESGTYGLIVVSQDGGTGHFSLGVFTTTADAGTPPAPRVTRFRGAVPNPVRGNAQFAFDLARASEVGFEVVNLAGRIVARVPARVFPAGSAQLAWNGRTLDGSPLARGLYFVRMRVDGAVSGGERKVIVN